MALENVYATYGVPDPHVVQYVDKNGVSLAYVSHAQITKALCEIDPQWTWEPALGADGLPAIRIQNGEIRRRDKPPIVIDMATMWGRLTLCGVTRWAVGSVEAHKPDLDKELVSDFLRNAAMRFGVALALWMKDGEEPSQPRPARIVSSNPGHETTRVRTTTQEGFQSDRPLTGGISEKQIGYIRGACKREGATSPVGLDGWSKADASNWIDAHKNGTPANQCPKPNLGDEEPF